MKPIILVIVGAAMLIPIMRHHNTHYSKELRKSRRRHIEQIQMKHDTETDVHTTGFWIDRLP